MEKWEYNTFTIDDSGNYVVGHDENCLEHYEGLDYPHARKIWAPLSGLGQQGWKLVAVPWVNGDEAVGIFIRISQ